MSEELIDELVRLVAQYGFECAETKVLAPRQALGEMFGKLRTALAGDGGKGDV